MNMAMTLRALAALAAVLAALCITIVVWAMLFEKPFLSYENVPFPTQIAQVKAGDAIPVTVRRCSTADGPRFYDISHELRSVANPEHNVVTLKGERAKITPGCATGTSRINVIPPGTPPGMYYVTGLGIVEGTLRTFAVPWSSQPFEVVP